MVPEILIVGDPSRRRELIDKVRECHYDVTLCAARELNRRVRTGPAPGAIILCIGDVDAQLLLAGLRRSRQGAAIPVVLAGKLGGEIRDLADVLDLGADHFLEDPVEADGLRDVLLELVGPASGRTETQIDSAMQLPTRTELAADRRGIERAGRSLGMVTERLDERELARRPRSAPESARDPMLGQLHRTLDRLEARLRDRTEEIEVGEVGPEEDIDLAGLGVESIPDIDGEEVLDPADSGAGLRFHDAGSEPGADQATDVGLDEGRRRPVRERERRSGWPERERTSTDRGDERSELLRGRRPGREAVPRSARISTRSSVPRTGSLDDQDVPRLLWRLHAERFVGLLKLQRGRAQKLVWLESGEVVFVRSNLSSDRFVDGLLRRGVLTRPQYETARRLAAKQPTRAGRLLVEAGFVKPREMHRLLQDHLTRVLDETFAWADGSWTLEPGEATDERVRIETPMPVMIHEGVRFRLEVEDLRARLGGRVLCPRVGAGQGPPTERAQRLAESLRVSPEEERCLTSFDGKHTLEQLVDESGDEHAVLALIYALWVLGEVELLGEPEPEVGSANLEQVDADRILERVRLAREADYFALLGLERDASRADVRRAYAELSATFDAHSLEPGTREQLARELGELRAALEEARDVLTDDAIRSAYLAHLGEP